MSEHDVLGDAIERLEWDERGQEDTPAKKWHQVTRRTALTGGAAGHRRSGPGGLRQL